MAGMRLQPIIVPGWQGFRPRPLADALWGRPCPAPSASGSPTGSTPSRAPGLHRPGRQRRRGQLSRPCSSPAASAAWPWSTFRCPARQGRRRPPCWSRPPTSRRPAAPECLRAFAPIPRHSLPLQSVVVASDDDLSAAWSAPARSPPAGAAASWPCPALATSTPTAGWATGPRALKLLAALRRRAGQRVNPAPNPRCRPSCPPPRRGPPQGA